MPEVNRQKKLGGAMTALRLQDGERGFLAA